MEKKPVIKQYWFGPNEEAIFIKYLQSNDKNEKEELLKETIEPLLKKIIKTQIRTYRFLSSNEDIDNVIDETYGYLLNKLDRFDTTKGYRVYAYCSTISKCYLFKKSKLSYAKPTRN